MKKIFIIVSFSIGLIACSFTGKPDRSIFIIPDSLFSVFPTNNEKFDKLSWWGNSDENARRKNSNFLTNNDSYIARLTQKRQQRLLSDAILKEMMMTFVFNKAAIIEIYECYDTIAFDSLISEYKSMSIASVMSQDNNYFTMEYLEKLYLTSQFDTTYLRKQYERCDTKLLTINFGKYFRDIPLFKDSTTICGLSKDYNILLLQSGNEYVLPKEGYYDWDILPESIRHGYRCGVAFKEDEPYLIYWVVAW